jgi:signal peptidase II
MKRFVFTFAAVMNLLLLDQAVKAAAIAHLKGAPPVTVLDGLFNLAYVENRGCAWGMFQGHVWPLAVFAILAMVFVIWKRRSIFPSGAVGAVAEVTLYAGILGNLVDRLWLGYVVDMFDFHWGIHHFPCFNVADVYINIAAGLLILAALFSGKKTERAADGA